MIPLFSLIWVGYVWRHFGVDAAIARLLDKSHFLYSL